MIAVRLINNPSDADIERMVDALDAAFGFNYFGHSLPGVDSVRSRGMLKSHITAALVDPGGEVYVAETESETPEVVGVATWHGPGSAFLSTAEQRALGWDQMIANVNKEQQEWWNYFLPFYDEYTTRALGEGTKLASNHLQALGIHPSHQRRGIGSALVKAGEDKAKAQGVPVCIETIPGDAVPFYRACGYDIKEPVLYKRVGSDTPSVALYAIIKTWD
ncbi:hypothetical protein AURDEDRAFT_162273 [Auricularia subglabra TFB-10046 SS5]|nr:hypothetical protein AURDEDRAFT_162273 [Auricularia subglabra TFB-10046 SS5]